MPRACHICNIHMPCSALTPPTFEPLRGKVAVVGGRGPMRLTVEMGCEAVPSGVSDLAEVRKGILAQLDAMNSD